MCISEPLRGLNPAFQYSKLSIRHTENFASNFAQETKRKNISVTISNTVNELSNILPLSSARYSDNNNSSSINICLFNFWHKLRTKSHVVFGDDLHFCRDMKSGDVVSLLQQNLVTFSHLSNIRPVGFWKI